MMEKSKLMSGPILVLGLVQLIESLAFALPLSFFPNYVLGLGASVASVGLFTSSFMVAFAVMSPRMGSLIDRYGRKRMMVYGIASDVLFGTITGLAPSWQWLLVIRFLNGAVSSAAMLATEAYLVDVIDPSRRGEAMGFLMAMQMVGRNIGPLVGGTVQWLSVSRGFSTLMSYRIPYFVDSAFAAIALILVIFKITEPEAKSGGPMGMRGPSGEQGGSDFSLTRPLKVLLGYAFVMGIGVGFIIPITALFFTDKFGTDPMGIGALISISGFVGLLASWIAGRISDQIGRKPLIAVGSYAARLFGFFIPLAPSITLAGAVMSLRSLGFNIMMPAFRALRADLVPPHVRGRVFGLFGTAFTAGSVVGPIISTWIYSTYRLSTFSFLGFQLPGYGIPFFINSILGILATTGVLLLIKEPEKTTEA
ncbi:MAG: MFS transporter [Candidatus Bathyarchaeota archaeon]|nr:MFS transporter [Candidatus Bathyarchaeota archaeon]